MVRQARAADLVTLVAAAPLLGFSLRRARSGSSSARMIAIGALGYLAYTYAIYGFSVVINPLTPIHIAILGLATWSLVLGAVALDDASLDDAAGALLPRRTTASFLIVVAVLFALLWLSQIAGAITSGTLPLAVRELNLPTSAIYALDLAFGLPVLALTGSWLLSRDRRGPAGSLAALCWLSLVGLSVLAIFDIDAAAGVDVDPVPVVIFGVVTGIAAVLAVIATMSTGASRPSKQDER